MYGEISTTSQVKEKMPITTFRVGYGHIRAAFALQDYLNHIFCENRVNQSFVEPEDEFFPIVDISDLGNSVFNSYLNIMDKGLGFCYRKIPEIYIKLSKKAGTRGMHTLSTIAQALDKDVVAKSLASRYPNNRISCSTHVVPSDLITGNFNFLTCIDPYASLYSPKDSKTFISAPNLQTALELKQLGAENAYVGGAIVSYPVYNSKETAKSRIQLLQETVGTESFPGINIAIATGGSGSHAEYITSLISSYIHALKNGDAQLINEISITTGDNSDMYYAVSNLINELYSDDTNSALAKKFKIIAGNDTGFVVRATDIAMAKADLIHAKTAELLYNVGAGKAFRTLNPPSLGIQEVCFDEFVRSSTYSTCNCISAVEHGFSDTDIEVRTVMDEIRYGVLTKRMEAGMQLNIEGGMYLAQQIADLL